MENSDKAWEKWGSEDPYFGVITDEKYRINNLTPETRREFFQSGERHINEILSNIRCHLDASYQPKKAVDFGCGIGRLILPLARVCQDVVGIDISDSMLAEAKRNCELMQLSNVSFIKSDDELSLLSGEYDLIHSFIVFQHIPVHRGVKILSNLLKHLCPGGIAVLHLTYNQKVSRFRKLVTWARHHVPMVHNFYNSITRRRFLEAPMQMNSYDINALMLTFQESGIQKVFLQFTNHGGHYGAIFYCQNELA